MPDGIVIREDVLNRLRLAQPRPPAPQTCGCPTCGGLECLCRPRFFPGQLLTDDDLNRLERYIVEKNKLHNRYLFGWGVVCGLNVEYNPCPGVVTVRSGYALSPCGEDIVVCQDVDINVCDLINRCRDKQRPDWSCEPYTERRIDCEDAPEEWILAVRYEEKPSRGVVPLTGSSGGGCCSRCTGDRASHSCGCGCGEAPANGNGHASTRRTARVPAQCEPTMICEGYVWDVYRAPGQEVRVAVPATEHFSFKAKRFIADLRPEPASGPALRDQRLDWLRNFKQVLIDHSFDRPDFARGVMTIQVPNPKVTGFATEYSAAAGAFRLAAANLLRSYLCESLLPPCPPPVDDPRVPLATITITRGDCRVRDICVHGARQVALTMPTLEHWMGPALPFGRLPDALARRCCDPRHLPVRADMAVPSAAAVRAAPRAASEQEVPAFELALHNMVEMATTPQPAEGTAAPPLAADPVELLVKLDLLDPMVSAAPSFESLTKKVEALEAKVAALTRKSPRGGNR